jgi:hypothetical protein
MSVIIDYRPGAGTIVATAAVAKAPPDGHTFLMATNSLLINPALDMKLPYDTYKDLTGVSMVATQPVALVANKDFPADTLGEVIAEAKKRGGKLDYTSPGPRGVGHLAGEMLKQRAGIDMTHINYNGSAPALTDMIAGRVPLMFDMAFRQALCGFRRPEADRGRRQGPAIRQAQRAHDCGNLSGLRRGRIQCRGGAGGDATSGRGEAVRRYPRGRRLERVCGKDQASRNFPAGQYTG